jgi:glucan phosphoethanolaminetransferase (alkaline phosphatase superfamily)
MHPDSVVGYPFDIRNGANSAGNAAIILAAFALTIIILLLGSADLRRDKMSSFVLRPFLVAFIGNLIASFQFMIVQSDQSLDEKTFALIIPAEFLAVVATTLMLFGITLAVLRRYAAREVRRLAVFLFCIAGLYSIGVMHFGIDALLHAHQEHTGGHGDFHAEVTLGVWASALLLLPLELAIRHLKVTPERLHSIMLWLVSFVVAASLLAFAVSSFMHANDSRDRVILPLAVFSLVFIQWLVFGSCLYLLRHFDDLEIWFPPPTGEVQEDDGLPTAL